MNLKRTFTKKIALLFALALFAAAAAVLPVTARAQAPDALATEIELPATYLEYRALNAPRDVYYDGEVTAILQTDNTVVLFQNGVYSEIAGNTNLSKVRRAGGALVIQQGASVMLYSLAEGGALINATYKAEGGETPLAYSAFDVSGTRLVAYAGTQIDLFDIEYDTAGMPVFVNRRTLSSSAGDVNHIAFNESGDVFFFDDSNHLSFFNVSSPETVRRLGSNFSTPTGIAADSEYVFLANEEKGLLRISIADGNNEVIVPRTETEIDIDDLVSPAGLALKDGNILVCDAACNKIVEFVEYGYDETEKVYRYSGFAITTTANADNRLPAVSSAISLCHGEIAVLTDSSVILNEKGGYRKIQFDSLELNYMPKHLVLGEKYICLADLRNITFIDRETLAKADCDAEDMRPSAVAYSNGFYYVLSDNAIYSFDEATLTPSRIAERSNYSSEDVLAVDVDGNIYVCKGAEVTKYIGVETEEKIYFSSAPLDIGVDLNGNVYALLSGNRVEYYRGGERRTKTLELHEQNLPADAEANAMAMNFDSDKIYFLFNGYGFILSTAEAENDSITNIAVPEGFALSADSALTPENLELVQPAAGKNLFFVSEEIAGESGEKFDYLSLAAADGKQYVYGGETQGFYILLGEEIALVKKADAQKLPAYTAAEERRAYAATSVHLYYFPVLTQNDRYVLTNAQRLPAKREIAVYGFVIVNGREFYYAEEGGKYGYVPSDFITFELYQTPQIDEFTPKILDAGKKGVTVYADETLGEVSEILYEDTEVKAYATGTENVYYVEYTAVDRTTAFGYVSGDCFLARGKHAVRNAVIIVLVTLSVTATSFYFINRKTKNKN